MNLDYLFVYGTLRRGCNNPMAQFLKESSDFVGNASYQGLLYRISYYPGLVPSKQPEHQVQGEMYQLHNADLILAYLDDYEECGVNFSAPTEYIRSQGWVKLDNGETVLAWLYFYNYSTIGLDLIKSGDFLGI
jgi:gamma-glutamylcyclotransferase (GGCT)/AIG2-like uncharacterized protein YtfP